MMDWTDRHCRYFLRQVSSRAFLYTEMITTGALLHGNVERHLAFSAEEHPVGAQLGGSEPDELAQCAKLIKSGGGVLAQGLPRIRSDADDSEGAGSLPHQSARAVSGPHCRPCSAQPLHRAARRRGCDDGPHMPIPPPKALW